MPTAWFFAPGVRQDQGPGRPGRTNLVASAYGDLLASDNGAWSAVEAYGNYFAVKVRCDSSTTLTMIAQDPSILRVPLSRLDDPTSSLTAAQRTAVLNLLSAMGFTNAEVNARFPGGWDGAYVIRDIVKFAVHRRLTPRYDSASDQIILDGAEVFQDGTAVDYADAYLS